ncbi:MAG: protein kinase, partial [Gemmatimonadaceae bacterium]
EIELTANLQHPHILPLFDSGDADGQLFYVMPFVDGETLRGRLDRETQLPLGDALRLSGEVLDALQYAHERGVIHRDIKPENILLQGGHALVADFGIALAVQQAGGQRMTQTGLSLGTPQYMAPEQAMGEKSVDARADIYALGAVTYEMLAGEPPFTGPSAQAIIARVLTSDAPALMTLRKSVPPHVADAVHRALEKLPADRFSDARTFANALTGAAASADTAPRRSRVDARASAGLGRVLAWSGVTLALGALGGWGIARGGTRASLTASSPLTVSAILPPAGGTLAQRRSIALTPDGTRLAFVFIGADGTRRLWVRRLDDPEAAPLSGTNGAEVPFWSPDGRALGFFNDGFLMVRDANGSVRQLCPAVEPTSASWGNRNVVVFTHRQGISTVDGNGGTCRLVVPRGSGTLIKAALLPDGERFVYTMRDTDSMRVARLDGTTIATLPFSARDVHLAPPHWLALANEQDTRTLDIQEMDWNSLTPRGPRTRLIGDIRNSGGEFTLAFAADVMAYLPGSIDLPYLEFDAAGVLRDSVHINGTWTIDVHQVSSGVTKVAVGGSRGGLWLYDLEGDRDTRLIVHDSGGPARRMLGGTYPLFSRDGTRLVYMVVRPGWCDIVVRDLATDVERVALHTPRVDVVCPQLLQWPGDEREVLAESDSVLRAMPLDGSPSRVVVARPGRAWDAQVSPDGRTIAYSSDESGRPEIYVRPIEAGTPTRVSASGGRWPRWGTTNGMLYFLSPDGHVMVTRMAGSGSARAPEPRVLFTVNKVGRDLFGDRGIGFAMTGDGQRFFIRQSPAGSALTIARPWTQLLRRADSARVTTAPPP